MSDLLKLAERVERVAKNAQISADLTWGWRRRDKRISIAFGQLGRDLRSIAETLRDQEAVRHG